MEVYPIQIDDSGDLMSAQRKKERQQSIAVTVKPHG
jgi:hypothetical protein